MGIKTISGALGSDSTTLRDPSHLIYLMLPLTTFILAVYKAMILSLQIVLLKDSPLTLMKMTILFFECRSFKHNNNFALATILSVFGIFQVPSLEVQVMILLIALSRTTTDSIIRGHGGADSFSFDYVNNTLINLNSDDDIITVAGSINNSQIYGGRQNDNILLSDIAVDCLIRGEQMTT